LQRILIFSLPDIIMPGEQLSASASRAVLGRNRRAKMQIISEKFYILTIFYLLF